MFGPMTGRISSSLGNRRLLLRARVPEPANRRVLAAYLLCPPAGVSVPLLAGGPSSRSLQAPRAKLAV